MKHRVLRGTLICALLTCCAGLAAVPQALAASAGLRRIGRAPELPTGARALGALAATTTIHATIALQPRDPAGLAAYAQQVSTPGSSVFHQYLSVAQFAARFGPASAQIDAVRAVLVKQGLHPGPVSANHLSVDVSAPAGAMASALSTSFERYALPGGRAAFANTRPPAVPDTIAGLVQGVVGLDTLTIRKPEPLARASGAPTGEAGSSSATLAGAAQPCSAASLQSGYTANRIASAYGFSNLYAAGDLGAGVTVALFELEPYSSSDVAAYQSCYGTSAAVANVAVDGGASCGSDHKYCGAEDVLDIEDVVGLASQANIDVYEGPNTNSGAYDTYRQIVTDDTAQVISTSWGLCEASEGSAAAGEESTLFQEAATQGQSTFAAAGDSGANDCGMGTLSVDDPASQPYVTGVGGTTLSTTVPPPVERVWNNSSGASGGGASSLWGQPSFQAGFAQAQSLQACGSTGHTCREVPDVSADADPNTGYVIYWNGSWSTWGGTSAAAPTWAALTTLADASTACAGTKVGFANAALYIAAGHSYSSYFNDIIVGNNTFGGVTGFSAGLGYDMPSGLGSPIGSPLAAALCGNWTTITTTTTTITPPTLPSGSTTTTTTTAAGATVRLTAPSSRSGRVGARTSLQIQAGDSAGLGLTYEATNLPRGLSINPATGLISGTPTTAGRFTVSLLVRDSGGNSASGSFVWTIAGSPRIKSASLSAGHHRRTTLVVRLLAGVDAAPLSTLVLAPPSGARFAGAGTLRRGVSVFAGSARIGVRVRKVHGAVRVVLRRPARTLTLRITAPAIALHGRSAAVRPWRVHVVVTVVDSHGVTTRLG